jgi:ERCC4-type nuclease
MNINITHIIFDTREARLYSSFTEGRTDIKTINTKIEPLTIGDIIFANIDEVSGEKRDVLIIERKSLSDLLSSIKDGRYEEQSHRLIHASQLPPYRILYIIEGMFSTLRNPAEKQLVISAMTSLQLYKGFGVMRTSSVQETADLIAGMWKKMQRNSDKGMQLFVPIPTQTNQSNVNDGSNEESSAEVAPAYSSVVKKVKKDNVTPENIGEIILCQIPGISSTIAVELMRKYENIRGLLQTIREKPDELKDMKINGRRMGSNVVESIVRFLG